MKNQPLLATRLGRLITIVDVRSLKPNDPSVWYVGRPFMGWKNSYLGNPYRIGEDGNRARCVDLYRRKIRTLLDKYQRGEILDRDEERIMQELSRIVEHLRRGNLRTPLVLGCWCYPHACHAEVIRAAVIYLLVPGSTV